LVWLPFRPKPPSVPADRAGWASSGDVTIARISWAARASTGSIWAQSGAAVVEVVLASAPSSSARTSTWWPEVPAHAARSRLATAAIAAVQAPRRGRRIAVRGTCMGGHRSGLPGGARGADVSRAVTRAVQVRSGRPRSTPIPPD
jgi:hypothetical protein